MRNKKTVVFVFTVFVIPLAIVIIAFFSRFEYGLLALVLPFCNIPAYIYSRYLMRQFRIQPFPCKRCGKMMRRLSEKEEDRYLSDSQQLEENINSRDHDVFLCDGCNETVIYSYDKNNIYSKCPRCGTKSFYKEGSRVMVQPTQTKDGIERTDYHCKYCGFDQHKDRKIPKIEVPPIIVGGGGRGSGGGFGGGGGSFGGGFSGGGGATTRW